MTNRYSGDVDGAIQFLANQISACNEKISALEFELIAERMLTQQLFHAVELFDPDFARHTSQALGSIADSFEGEKRDEILAHAKTALDKKLGTAGAKIIAARMREASEYKLDDSKQPNIPFSVIPGGKDEAPN